MKELAIIIVSWNVKNFLVQFLKSIFEFTKDVDYEIIVVDNDSKDNTVEKLKAEFGQEINQHKLKILAEKENHGFSKANNIGWKASNAKYVWFLNPDMEFIENSGLKMLNFVMHNPQIKVFGCKLLYEDQTIQPTIKNFPKLLDQILILLKLHHFIKTKSLKKYLAKDFDYSEVKEVDQLMGACILTNREILEKINGWDEDYWLWWEDVDFCKKIKDLGYKIAYTPIIAVKHFEGKSFEQVASLAKQKRFNRGMRTYFKKHHGYFAYLILSILSPISLLLAWITQLFKIQPKSQSRI